MITAPKACPGTRIHRSVNLAKLNCVIRKAFVCSPRSVLWPRRTVAGLSPLMAGLDPLPVHVRFTVDKCHRDRFISEFLTFYCVSVVPSECHIHSSVCHLRTWFQLHAYESQFSRSRWPRSLRRRSAATRLLGLRVRIPLGGKIVFLLGVLCVVK